MKVINSWIRRAISFVVVVIVILLVADLNQQLMALSNLKEQLKADESLLMDLSEHRDDLLILKDYSASDKAVEDFARQEGYMAKPGDTVYVVMPEQEIEEDDSRKSYSEFDNDQSNLERWFYWLFGN